MLLCFCLSPSLRNLIGCKITTFFAIMQGKVLFLRKFLKIVTYALQMGLFLLCQAWREKTEIIRIYRK